MRFGVAFGQYIEVDQVKTRLSVLLCILSSISAMPLGFDAAVRLDSSSLGIITKGTTRLQNVNTLTRCLDRAISRHRKVGSQIAKVLGPGWRLKDNENMHDS